MSMVEVRRYAPESNKLDHANEVVTFAKNISSEVSSFVIPNDIDFIGASYGYCNEKITAAIRSLEWLNRRLKECSVIQRK